MKQTFTITESDAGQRLDVFLASETDISRSKIKNYIKDGCVKINDQISKKPDYTLKEQDEISLELEELADSSGEIVPNDIPLDIIYEDDDLIVLNKQAALTVHPGAATHHDTLVNALAFHFGDNLSSRGGSDRPGIVHRLDRDTTGLMVVAKNDKVHELLSNDLAEKRIKRYYKALVWGLVKEEQGEIRTNIDRSKSDRSRRAVCREPKGKLAVTHYKLIQEFSFMSLVECQLETGRTHQIRVHMSHIGHSVVGDQVYGNNSRKIINHTSGELKAALENLKRQALHSYKLEFAHPISKEDLKFEIPLPNDIEDIISLI